MKRLLVAGLALALSACAGITGLSHIPTAPADVANATTLDEKGGLTITVAYNAANRLGLLAIRTGAAKGATAEKIKLLDARAFGWVKRARSAYLAGNAADFRAAEREAKAIITDLTDLAS
jgi:hypothetical protein